MERIIKCQICGKEIVTTIATKKYCVECANNRSREKAREYHKRNKMKNKQADEEAKKQVKKMMPQKKKPSLSINDIIRMSMAAGRSGVKYGEDVMLIEGGKLK